jgi:hypothetical protein
MSSELLTRRFAAIGARLAVEPGPWRGAPRLDVRDETFVLGFTGRSPAARCATPTTPRSSCPAGTAS